MITHPTVLVVGAGGSVPFGFPTGFKLVERILNWKIRDKIVACGFTEKDAIGFQTSLKSSGRQSVDAFLEHRPELIKIGKVAIACALVPLETEPTLFATENRPSWYDHLFQKLNAPKGEFVRNKIQILTFNYDRSLDHYIYTAIRNSYGLDDKSTKSLFDSIPITHLHGQLGSLSERPYSAKSSPSSIAQAADGILIIHEGDTRQKQFEHAQRMLQMAERIYFVGFGYDPVNIKRLHVEKIPKTTRIFGSTYDMTDAEIQLAVERFGGHLNAADSVLEALDFFRDIEPLDS